MYDLLVFKTLRILAASGTVTPEGITWRASECLATFAIVACPRQTTRGSVQRL